jgi:hypothetical protein
VGGTRGKRGLGRITARSFQAVNFWVLNTCLAGPCSISSAPCAQLAFAIAHSTRSLHLDHCPVPPPATSSPIASPAPGIA